MMRLLQGDVGSGKTVVALAAMLDAVETGAQAALMAPTEILARQHYATLTQLAAGSGVEIALLTGREKGRTRAALLGASRRRRDRHRRRDPRAVLGGCRLSRIWRSPSSTSSIASASSSAWRSPEKAAPSTFW